jgi:threonine efflux protein
MLRQLAVFKEILSMSYFPALFTLAFVFLLACISPGPDFVNVTAHALHSRRAGIFASLGVAAGCMVWATSAVFGITVILSRMAWLYEIVRIGGAAYLVYLGAKALLGARRSSPPVVVQSLANNGWTAFKRGFVTDMTNPKSVVFFGSLLATILPPGAPLWVHCAATGIIGVVSCCWFVFLTIMFSVGKVRSVYLSIRRAVDALLGVFFVALGVRIAVTS